MRYYRLVFLSLILLVAVPAHSEPFKMQFSLIDNRIFIPVYLNGHGPYQCVLDTGGGDSISVTPEVAEQVRLPVNGKTFATGAGAGKEAAVESVIDDVRIGGVRLQHQDAYIFSLTAVQTAMGFRHFDGVIGQGVLKSLVTTIDYERSQLTFAPPDDRPRPGTRVPLRFLDSDPVIDITVDGLSGTYLLDTGDRSSLSFSGPFAAAHALLARYHASILTTTGWGIGGPIPGWVFRVPDVDVGGLHVSDVVTRIPTLKSGFFASPKYAGILGNGVLKRFRVTLDYPHRALYLETRKHPLPREAWDRSGVWLASADRGFRIQDIVKNSPADHAGLQVDDVVVKIDGRDAGECFLPDVRDMLKQPDRSTVQLTIERDHVEWDITLYLTQLL